MISFSFPTTILVGPEVRFKLIEHLKANSFSRPLIVTDAIVKAIPVFADLMDRFFAQKIEPIVYDETSGNPVKSHVMDGLNRFQEGP